MSMDDSTEFGWLIRNKDSYEYVGPLFDNAKEDVENASGLDLFIPGTNCHPDSPGGGFLEIETHPHNLKCVFVSWIEPEHGFQLGGIIEPCGLSVLVRDFIKTLDPAAGRTKPCKRY